MSDLIDRQALLKQIGIDSDGEPGYYGDTWKFIDTIKSMPPAELGTDLAEVGTDCISRQAEIEAMAELQGRASTKAELKGISKAWKMIKQLPPIQPKRGKWNRLGRDVFNCNKCGATFVLNQGGEKMCFCPNCGADMRQKGENSESD